MLKLLLVNVFEVKKIDVMETTTIANYFDFCLTRENSDPQLEFISYSRLRLLTFRETFFPKVTSPDTVRWSSSSMSGMLSNLDRNS